MIEILRYNKFNDWMKFKVDWKLYYYNDDCCCKSIVQEDWKYIRWWCIYDWFSDWYPKFMDDVFKKRDEVKKEENNL